MAVAPAPVPAPAEEPKVEAAAVPSSRGPEPEPERRGGMALRNLMIAFGAIAGLSVFASLVVLVKTRPK